ncbi:ETC complex I subunit [uncultured Sphingomonas sp.]|uniref:ETC complex I subunit n=1 Tax=uncultured Sphingomonas sp. TaxID=158754 RepID=UPI0025DDA092|nr:ETC complex I subunit [uncultured Sphingomonas sp.]
MTQARIHERIKSSMQSGRAHDGLWLVEYEPREAKRADPLTGWAGSGDTREQVRLSFPTLDAAKAYCDRHGLSYHVTPSEVERRIKLQTYADNFRGVDISF